MRITTLLIISTTVMRKLMISQMRGRVGKESEEEGGRETINRIEMKSTNGCTRGHRCSLQLQLLLRQQRQEREREKERVRERAIRTVRVPSTCSMPSFKFRCVAVNGKNGRTARIIAKSRRRCCCLYV